MGGKYDITCESIDKELLRIQAHEYWKGFCVMRSGYMEIICSKGKLHGKSLSHPRTRVWM